MKIDSYRLFAFITRAELAARKMEEAYSLCPRQHLRPDDECPFCGVLRDLAHRSAAEFDRLWNFIRNHCDVDAGSAAGTPQPPKEA